MIRIEGDLRYLWDALKQATNIIEEQAKMAVEERALDPRWKEGLWQNVPLGEDLTAKNVSKDAQKAKGGHARAKVLTPSKRKKIAQKAARARWNK